eukprot:TRINITY_DN114658_c0_g1_i1.p1 TRINITY_DN114658_c0_g1~~TRINITY_DN114658_c0_g1_i1.p1  ORF type:complete len:276 (+),score=93.31 TRINITY_DN114658_c0_g1_i1:101-928(+)
MGADCSTCRADTEKIMSTVVQADSCCSSKACGNAAINCAEVLELDANNKYEKETKSLVNQQLLSASRMGDLDKLREALSMGAHPETRRPFQMRPRLEPYGRKKALEQQEGLTSLMYCAQNGTPTLVKELVLAKADVNASDEDGMQPLHFAASAASKEACQLLIQAGAKKAIRDDTGKRPLDYVPKELMDDKIEAEKWKALLRPESQLEAHKARIEQEMKELTDPVSPESLIDLDGKVAAKQATVVDYSPFDTDDGDTPVKKESAAVVWREAEATL